MLTGPGSAIHDEPVARIALLGAESTGKSTLARELGNALPALVLPEVLRDWCQQRGRTPEASEQADIMHMQIRAEARLMQQARDLKLRWLVVDSAPLAVAIYSLMLFNDASLLATALDHHRHYQFTLYARNDLGWVADGFQRDGPQAQTQADQLLRAQLTSTALPMGEVAGQGAQRLQAALDLLRSLGR